MSSHAHQSLQRSVAATQRIKRTALTLHEAAVLTGWTERELRRALDCGRLSTVWDGRRRCVVADEIAALIAESPLATTLLAAVRAGRLRVPRWATCSDHVDLLTRAVSP